MKVKLTITESKCRANLHKKGEEFIVDDTCPPICHELWQNIYPNVYVLLNGGDLDFGSLRTKKFTCRCNDSGRVLIQGEVISDEKDGVEP